MAFHEDWLIRQIQMVTESIARLMFNTDVPKYHVKEEANSTEVDKTARAIDALLLEERVNDAEDLLFASLDIDNRESLLLAMDFYCRLNAMSDAQLEAAGFSREEIDEGLRDVVDQFGLSSVLPKENLEY